MKHTHKEGIDEKGNHTPPRKNATVAKPVDVRDGSDKVRYNPTARAHTAPLRTPEPGKEVPHTPHQTQHKAAVRADKPAHLPTAAPRDATRLRSHTASIQPAGKKEMIPASGGERNLIQSGEGNKRAYAWRK